MWGVDVTVTRCGGEWLSEASDAKAARPGTYHVTVVGGGIAGLATAYFLGRDGGPGLRVSVLEAASTLGGKLRVDEVAGLPVDSGAEALLARRPEGLDLVAAAGLGDEIVTPATIAATIWARTRLLPLPGGHLMGVPTGLAPVARSGLLSRAAVTRVALDRVLPRTPVEGDVTVGRYVAARMGRAVVDYLVEPLLGGVYAGHADRLSLEMTIPALASAARAERSLIVAARRTVRDAKSVASGPVFAGVRGGLGRLPVAVARASGAAVHTGTIVRDLRRTATGWQLVAGPTGAKVLEADAVVLAVSAPSAARLLEPEVPAAAAPLRTVEYGGIAIVALAFPRTAFSALPHGSGFLVPPVDGSALGRTIKAATYSSLKWGWLAEADPGTVVVRTSIGRHGEEENVATRTDTELIAASVRDLGQAVGVHGKPIDARVTRWPQALPQYAVGHRRAVELTRQAVAAVPGLAVCGAAYDGVGIPACVASARMAADRILAQVPWRRYGEGEANR
jgi:protoporphyrinogen/coproporphyrinogen III oxidase